MPIFLELLRKYCAKVVLFTRSKISTAGYSILIDYDEILRQAAFNVGGIVLNALAIEHFILRHPCESKHVSAKRTECLSPGS